jgi:hypothetical protein
MKDRAKLKQLMAECLEDAKEITIYRDVWAGLAGHLFHTRLSEVPEVIVEPVETITPTPAEETTTEAPTDIPADGTGESVSDVTVTNTLEEKEVTETPKEEETPKDEETKS